MWKEAAVEIDKTVEEEMWNHLQRNLDERKILSPKKRRWQPIIYKVAATILLPVCLGLATYFGVEHMNKVSQDPFMVAVDYGQKANLTLPDGTKVWLNSATHLSYDAEYNKSDRKIYLDGEAYFEVARNTSHPFVVDMNRMEIEVLGTTFDARYERTSGIAETTLNSGSICVRTSRSQQSVRLRPDERLVFNETSGSMIIEQVNASNYNSWIQPTLTFFDMTLEDIITNLERWFNVPIGTDASVDRTIRLSFHVRHESLEETLQVISLITGLQYTLDSESATFHTARTTR